MEEQEQGSRSIKRQIVKSAIGGLLGIIPGVILWLTLDKPPRGGPNILPFIMGFLGVAAGIGLTLPGVSGKRVAKGVAVGMTKKALPRFVQKDLLRAVMGEQDEVPKEKPVPPPETPGEKNQ